jgi:hypothetical protein
MTQSELFHAVCVGDVVSVSKHVQVGPERRLLFLLKKYSIFSLDDSINLDNPNQSLIPQSGRLTLKISNPILT